MVGHKGCNLGMFMYKLNFRLGLGLGLQQMSFMYGLTLD